MSLVPVQGGIYHDPEEGRYYHFLLWYCQGRRRCQTVDFATVAEAGCFLSGFGIFTIRGGPGFAEATGISYAVGAMMPSLLALIVGCWLLQKPKKR